MLIFLGQFLKIVRRFLNKHYWGAVLFVLIWTPHQMGQYKTQFDDPHIGATIPAKGMTADVVPQESGISPFDRPVFRAMDFLTASEGWAFFDQQLYWTKDGGATWTEIKPRKEDEPILLTPFFMDTTNGWIATYANQQFVISQTTDGGITWNT